MTKKIGWAWHLKNRKVDGYDENGHRSRQTLDLVDAPKRIYRLNNYNLTPEELERYKKSPPSDGAFVVYLHERKTRPSEFGGTVLKVLDEGVVHNGQPVFAIEFRFEPRVRGRSWRGRNHQMAFNGVSSTTLR